MIEYRVFCKAIAPNISVIYAKATKHSECELIEWQASDVTLDAIDAVVQYMYLHLMDGEKSFSYEYKTRDCKRVKLTLEEITDPVEGENGSD